MSRRRTMSVKMVKEIGMRIRAARMTAGYPSSQAFAEKMEIDANTYRRYERGEVVPDVELLARFAEETGYTLDWIIAGVGAARRSN